MCSKGWEVSALGGGSALGGVPGLWGLLWGGVCAWFGGYPSMH